MPPVEQSSSSTNGQHPQLHGEEDRGQGQIEKLSIDFWIPQGT